MALLRETGQNTYWFVQKNIANVRKLQAFCVSGLSDVPRDLTLHADIRIPIRKRFYTRQTEFSYSRSVVSQLNCTCLLNFVARTPLPQLGRIRLLGNRLSASVKPVRLTLFSVRFHLEHCRSMWKMQLNLSIRCDHCRRR